MKKNQLFLLIFMPIFIFSCGKEKIPSINPYDEALLPGTGTAEYGIELEKGRWHFLTTEGFPEGAVVLSECPNRITQISFQDPKTVVVKDFGYSQDNIFSDYFYYWGCYYLGGCYIEFFDSASGDSTEYRGNERDFEGGNESEEENVETDVDIYALKDNYLFSLNRYSGVVISDISDPSNPYIEKIIPLNGYPAEMFLYGRYMVVGYAGYNPGYFYYYSNTVTPTSSVEVWDVKKPEDASLVDSEEVKGELVQLLKNENVILSLSIGSREIFVTSFRFKGEKGEIEKVSEENLQSSLYYYYLFRTSRMILKNGYLVVAVPDEYRNWNKDLGFYTYGFSSTINIYRIEDGELLKTASAMTKGFLDDERRMDIKDGVLRVISGDWGNAYATTISLENGKILDEVEITTGERLYATAFQGDIGYAVTFRRIDPLFAIDFSDPGDIKIPGELEVVGWSEQLYPFEDKLLSLGPQENSVALSLYDASDLSNVKMLSRLLFGENSASEVYNDYKSFLFLPEKNLIAFPYTEMRWFNFWWWGWSVPLTNYVQFVELKEHSLSEAGKIKHHGVVRRIIPEDEDNFITLSNEALQLIDLKDINSPSTLSELRLVREVRDVLTSGNYALLLLNFEQGEESSSSQTDQWKGYYRYELANINEKTIKPIALLISAYRIKWMKEYNDRLILMLSSSNETLFYSVKIKNGDKKIEIINCLDLTSGIRASGKNILTSDYLYASFGNYYPPGYYYDEYSLNITRYLLKIDPSTLEILGAFRIGTGPDFENPDYSSSFSYYSDLAGVSSDGATFYYFNLEGSYSYYSGYDREFTFYVLKVNLNEGNFSIEKINVPGEPLYMGGDEIVITENTDRYSAFDISFSPPQEKGSIPRSSENFDTLLKTKNYYLYSELRYKYPETKNLLKSYVFDGENFSLSITKEIDSEFYYSLIGMKYALWFENQSLIENSDWVFLGIKDVFIDPIVLRNNHYCLEQNCFGEIYEGQILHAGNLKTLDFKTSNWNTNVAEGGGKLLIPRGKLGVEVVEDSQ